MRPNEFKRSRPWTKCERFQSQFYEDSLDVYNMNWNCRLPCRPCLPAAEIGKCPHWLLVRPCGQNKPLQLVREHTQLLFIILFAFSPDAWCFHQSGDKREAIFSLRFPLSQQGLKLYHLTLLRVRHAHLRRWCHPPMRLMSWWTLIPTPLTSPCPVCQVRRRLTHADIASQRRSWSLSPWSRRPVRCWCQTIRRYYTAFHFRDCFPDSRLLLERRP